MKKKILALFLILSVLLGGLVSAPVFADGEEAGSSGSSCDTEFLGLRPWYYGLTEGVDCKIKSPTDCKPGATCDAETAGNSLATFIWAIILNVLVDVFVIAGIVALGFVIYGGYLYLRSGGDVAFATKGRKTLTAALVGLVIVTLANVISRLIVTVITSK